MPGYTSFFNLPFREHPGDTVNALRGARNSGLVNHWLWQPLDRQWSPEESLLASILLMAVKDYRNPKHGQNHEKLRKDATWFFQDTSLEYDFAFENCCEALKINSSWFRKKLAEEDEAMNRG